MKLSQKSKLIAPCSDPPSDLYTLRFDAYQASQLCETCVPDNTELQLQLQVGSLVLRSCTLLAERGGIVWHEMLPERTFRLPSQLLQCPDLFISIFFRVRTDE